LPILIPPTAPLSSSSSSIIRSWHSRPVVPDVPSGLSLTPPQETKKKKTDRKSELSNKTTKSRRQAKRFSTCAQLCLPSASFKLSLRPRRLKQFVSRKFGRTSAGLHGVTFQKYYSGIFHFAAGPWPGLGSVQWIL
jgi:hypothetical protein